MDAALVKIIWYYYRNKLQILKTLIPVQFGPGAKLLFFGQSELEAYFLAQDSTYILNYSPWIHHKVPIGFQYYSSFHSLTGHVL